MTDTEYSVYALPERLIKKYRYAVRFMELLRSKTPKIVYQSARAKCYWMENGPTPDVECKFSDSPSKPHIRWRQGRTVLQLRQSPTAKPFEIRLSDPTQPVPEESVPKEWRDRVRHAQSCLQACLETEKKTEGKKETLHYPLFLSHRSSAVLQSSPSMTQKPPRPTQKQNYHSAPSTPGTANTMAPLAKRSAATSLATTPTVTNSASLATTPTNAAASSMEPPPSPTPPFNRSLGSFSQMKFAHRSNVGWCCLVRESLFYMLFDDGSRMDIDSKASLLHHYPANDQPFTR